LKYFVVVVSFFFSFHPSIVFFFYWRKRKRKIFLCVDLWIFEPHHRFNPTKMKISGCPPKRWRRPAAL
jgi:hypothetical protein